VSRWWGQACVIVVIGGLGIGFWISGQGGFQICGGDEKFVLSVLKCPEAVFFVEFFRSVFCINDNQWKCHDMAGLKQFFKRQLCHGQAWLACDLGLLAY
ncbi:MAG: hypothetical protein RBR67_20920, partial [Desulfobacterium sp.]|nr:hypothetical protein [Desulfobacterium sp.]